MSREAKLPHVDRSNKGALTIADLIGQEVESLGGSSLTFEQRRDLAWELVSAALWNDTDRDLRGLVTTAEEIELDGQRYRRLEQDSSAIYYGCFGSHPIEEKLYREVGVHNGKAIKPIELRVGMIAEHMTPDFARMVGEIAADRNSREIERTLRAVRLTPPSRAFLEKRVTQMAGEIAAAVDLLEDISRQTTEVPPEIASVSCGLDRMTVRMAEPAAPDQAAKRPERSEPYERTRPAPKDYHYRKAWVGSTTTHDLQGNELHTYRYAVEADADPTKLAERVAADVAWILQERPTIPIHCIQDAAPELRALPEGLECLNIKPRELIDFEHLAGYLDNVVDACEPVGDPRDRKGWYRRELLRDDYAIDRIWRKLRNLAKTLPGRHTKARKSVGAALSYIRKRKAKMRYASLHAANLPIGSGATESTCWVMQQRVKRPGQSWEASGLRGILALRGLVLSDRWPTAWPHYAENHRAEIKLAA